MKITLYQNLSELNKLDKTLIYQGELNGTLRQPTDILNPSIEIEFKEYNLLVTSTPSYSEYNLEIAYGNDNKDISYSYNISLLDVNYAYIDEFKRYYYINDKTFISNKIMRLSLNIDVLMSFKETILNQRGLIYRNEFEFYRLIKDDIVSFDYNKTMSFYELYIGGDTKFNKNSTYQDNNISIAVINNQRYVVSQQGRPTPPSNELSSPYFWNGGIIAYSNVYATDVEEMNHLAKWLIDDNNLASYVLKITAFPFVLKNSNSPSILWLGDEEIKYDGDLPSVHASELSHPQGEFYTICSQIVNIGINSFLDREPYTTYDIFIPYVGYVPIDSDKVINKVIKVSYAVDYVTGNAQVYVISDDKVVYTANCQLGVDIPINSTNALQVQNNNISNAMGLSLGLLGGFVGMATGNPLAVTGGVLAVSKSIASYVNNANTNYNNASGTYGTSNGGLFGKSTAHIRMTKMITRGYGTNEFNHLYGRPLNEVRNLKDLRGFTKVGEINLENFTCSNIELTMIETDLKKGIIL